MKSDGRLQGGGRRQGEIAHAGDEFARPSGRSHRHHAAIARDRVALVVEARRLDLEALDGGIDVARGPGPRDLLAQDVPGLNRLAQLDLDAFVGNGAVAREAELEERREPLEAERMPGAVQVLDHVAKVERDEVRQHEFIVQPRRPVDQLLAARMLPEAGYEGAQQQDLHEAHARVRRHLEGAKLEQPEASGRRAGSVQLVDRELRAVRVAGEVDEEIAQDPVHEPRLLVRLADLELLLELLEGDLALAERVWARLVDARALARRADEHPREEV